MRGVVTPGAQLLLAALLLVSSAAHQARATMLVTGADGCGPPLVRVEDGKLSVSLINWSATEALEMVARQSGVRMVFKGDAGIWRLTASFDSLPLEQGLRRLLHGTSHAFVYAAGEPNRRLRQVFVMPDAASQIRDAAGAQPVARGADTLGEALHNSGIRQQLEESIMQSGATMPADQLDQGVAEPVLNGVLREVLAAQPTDGRSLPDSREVLGPVDARLDELLIGGPARND